MTDQSIEEQIIANGLTAPRVTKTDIDDKIAYVNYFTAADGAHGARLKGEQIDIPASLTLLTFCVITLKNGFTVTGESACASPENFNADIGKQIAYQNAYDKIWPLLGYQLKDRLFNPGN